MSRQQLPVGAHGNIKTKDITPDGQKRPRVWQAQCRVRDADGVTRQVKRTGASRAAAELALQQALSERRRAGDDELTAESTLARAGGAWLEQRRADAATGTLAPGTLRVYESAWRLHVEPALGQLRLRELTVARCERWQRALREHKGAATTRTARAVLSGVLGEAARLGALPTNPVRDLSRIGGGPRRPPRALTRDEVTAWISGMEDLAPLRAQLHDARLVDDADRIREASARIRVVQAAVRWDVPDLTRFMLATGCRVGEALAVTWDEVDLDVGAVTLAWHLVRVTGEGLQRVPGTKRGDGRRVRVPSWCIAMLMRRRLSDRPGQTGWAVFPDSRGGWKDPSNQLRALREARDAVGFGWVTSHVFRKTCATLLDGAGLSAREIADVLEHSDPSLTQRVYMGRGIASEAAAAALEDLM